ncbi:hypothetical protein AB205_0172840 [Aquarana catesbeiana]|uniref:Uncharacterized protein n=1 Tax=Aquarana catesbeiana TaxID=8400 RepID=A0A2G9SKA1_AQUCT|nr:hypothetical protein AB205_0172840 [Aquarana catesbeiana]
MFFHFSHFFTFTFFTVFTISIHFFQNTILAIIPTHVEWVVAVGHAMWRFSWLGWCPLPHLQNRQPFGVPSTSMLAKHSALADILLLYPTPDEWHIAMKRVEFPWGAQTSLVHFTGPYILFIHLKFITKFSTMQLSMCMCTYLIAALLHMLY